MEQKTASSPDEPVTTAPAVTKNFVLAAFDRYQARLTSYAVQRCHGDIHAARDSVQHTFMQLCKQKQEQVQENTAAWLYATCRNRIIDDFRRRENQNGSLPPEWDTTDPSAIDPAVVCERNELLIRLKAFVRQLPDDQRDVVDLWCHGFVSSEIATITDQKAGSVRVKLHRAIKKLQEHPEVSNWLERATGQQESGGGKPRGRPVSFPSVARCPSSSTGEQS